MPLAGSFLNHLPNLGEENSNDLGHKDCNMRRGVAAMMKRVRAASVQFEASPENKRYNLQKITDYVKQAAEQQVQMIIFPECCITGYWFLRKLTVEKLRELAEPALDGPSAQSLLHLSGTYHMMIGAGLVEIDEDGKMYNTFIVAMPDGTVHRHRKIHAFESEYIESGEDYTVFDTPFGCKVGVLICYDNNINENVRITALNGADIVFAPHQTGGCNSIDPHSMKLVDRALWENRDKEPKAIEDELCGPKGRGWLMRWLPSRAHDNGVFYVFSNGIGIDDDEIRTGNAMILDPYGRILAETCKAGDDMVIADLDLALLSTATGRRWIKSRRPELYESLAVPTGAEVATRKLRFGWGSSEGAPTK